MGSRYKVVDLEEKDKKYIYSAGTTYLCSYLLRMIILNQGTHLLRCSGGSYSTSPVTVIYVNV